MALEVGNGGDNGSHQDIAQHNSSLRHMQYLSVGNHVPHHHQGCTNWGSLMGWRGLFLTKLMSKATKHANPISHGYVSHIKNHQCIYTH